MPTPALSHLRHIAAVTVTLAVSVIVVPTASADAPVAQGWWSATNLGPLAVPAPDVPDDGLLVQGPAESPGAYAALAYEIPQDTTADRLVLIVAPDTASTGAEVQLCPLVDPGFEPAQGGPIGEAPEFDCTQNTTAAPATDGTTYSFDISTLASTPTLAVAVLPTGVNDRVVFSQPGIQSLVFDPTAPGAFPPPTSAQSGGTMTAPPTTGGDDFAQGTAPDFEAPSAPESFPVQTPEPVTDTPAGTGAAEPSESFLPAASPTIAEVPVAGHVNLLLALLVLVATGAAATLWGLAGRARPDEAETTVQGATV